MEIIAFIKEHFVHAGPILLCAIFSVAVFLERFYLLFLRYPLHNTKGFFEKIGTLVMSANLDEASRLCDQNPGKPVAQVVKTALTRAHLPSEIIEEGLNIAIQDTNARIVKRTSYLPTIANVATLLGLLGTIGGLIQSFQAVAHADAQQKSALLSAGIATAMNATMLGLGVAIPCMLAYSLLMNRANSMLTQCEQAGSRTLDLLKQRFYSAEIADSDGVDPRPNTKMASSAA